MSVLEINSKNKLSPESLRKWLQEQSEVYDPLEELLRLQQELGGFEQRYSLASDEFIRRYEAGDMGDDINFVRWAGHCRLYANLKRAISTSLKLVVSHPTTISAT